ncbi:MAG: Fe-S cluster assembly protein SufD [Caldithrix sp. RBG_13_44_9]|nr:MAG: Fe-S cluster assembly protein SufD [Caldithrix sp. RBG_13_44_9]
MVPETINLKDWLISTFNNFENRLNGNADQPFHRLRREAISHFARLGFPNTRMEDWKYTNLQPLLDQRYQLFDDDHELKPAAVEKLFIGKKNDNRLVFVNGKFSEKFSNLHLIHPGITLSNLEKALQDHPRIVNEYIAKYSDHRQEAFTALNTAFAREGIFLYVPQDVVVEEPIYILHIFDPQDEPYQAHPRHLLVVEKNSQVKIVESHHSLSDGPVFNNSVTEVILKEGSRLDLLKIQDDNFHSIRIHRTQIYQERQSILNSFSIDLGGAIVRNNLTVSLNGENCESNLFGFYLASGNQLIDNHTSIEHLKPNCNSNELYKGILSGKSRGVFSGTIYVARDAQKTNAFQSNKNLLLSPEADINSKPQLKIFADDVKCTHGATVGQLDEEAIFYMQQRGIPPEQAQNLLRLAFAGEVIDKTSLENVRVFLQDRIEKRLEKEF